MIPTNTSTRLYRALKVIMTDTKTSAILKEVDPQAHKQAKAAIESAELIEFQAEAV